MEDCLLVSDQVEAHVGSEIDRVAPGLARVVLRGDGPDADPARVTAAFFSGDLYPDRVREFVIALAKAEHLRWLQTFSAGIDHPWFRSLIDRGVVVTTASGASAVPIAHTVFAYLLALSRDLRAFEAAQQRGEWQPRDVVDLAGSTLGIVGLGPIGLEVARLGRAFDMHVIGLRRTPRGDEPCETWPLARLPELLPRADWLVLALPLTPQTHHLLDAAAFERLKPGARLVNVGRGALVDEAALVRALQSGRLAGAGLDVFEVEPLPPESPLWSMREVIVTPHCSGKNPGNDRRAERIFVEHLARFARGEPLVRLAG